MNKLIKELIAQATTKEEFYPAGCNGCPEYRYDFDKEKFAQLIIRACGKHITDQQDLVETNWQCKDGIHIVYSLKEHFGVDE